MTQHKVRRRAGESWETVTLDDASGPGGSTPSGTGWVHVTDGSQDAAASTPTAANVGADATGTAASAVSAHSGLTTRPTTAPRPRTAASSTPAARPRARSVPTSRP